jgi:hypothetical protein
MGGRPEAAARINPMVVNRGSDFGPSRGLDVPKTNRGQPPAPRLGGPRFSTAISTVRRGTGVYGLGRVR